MLGDRAAGADACPPRLRLGEATGRGVGAFAGSGVGRLILGSGVDSRIVSATPPLVGLATGEPPTVTTTNGWLGSTE